MSIFTDTDKGVGIVINCLESRDAERFQSQLSQKNVKIFAFNLFLPDGFVWNIGVRAGSSLADIAGLVARRSDCNIDFVRFFQGNSELEHELSVSEVSSNLAVVIEVSGIWGPLAMDE